MSIHKAAFSRATFSCEIRHFAFFSFSNRVGHLHGARFTWDLVCAISLDTPQKKMSKSQQSLTRERFYRDARIRLQLAEVTYMLRLRASDSHKIESAEESLSHWFTYTVRDSFKARLAGFEFANANCCKSTSNAPLVCFCVWNNHASEFWNENVWSQRGRKTKYWEYN